MAHVGLILVESDVSKLRFQLGHELLRRQVVERLKDPVVVHDFEVVARVDDRHEKVEVFIPIDGLACRQSAFLAHLADIERRCRTMMAISDVSVIYFFELLLEKAVLSNINFPETMQHWNVRLVLHLLH